MLKNNAVVFSVVFAIVTLTVVTAVKVYFSNSTEFGLSVDGFIVKASQNNVPQDIRNQEDTKIEPLDNREYHSTKPVFLFAHSEPYPKLDSKKVIHIKTPNKTRDSEMWRYDIKGYAYGEKKPIDFTCVGYFYASAPPTAAIVNGQCQSKLSDEIPINQYFAMDGHLYLKFGPINRYYLSFEIDYLPGNTGQKSRHSFCDFKVYAVSVEAGDNFDRSVEPDINKLSLKSGC